VVIRLVTGSVSRGHERRTERLGSSNGRELATCDEDRDIHGSARQSGSDIRRDIPFHHARIADRAQSQTTIHVLLDPSSSTFQPATSACNDASMTPTRPTPTPLRS
jgi:hypothetical protein